MAKQLQLQYLSKAYSPKVVPVRDISLTVEEGEFLTLLGPSGCGKSTILRLIAGLEHPSSGRVLINGRDVSRLGPGDRNLAMVFQSYALYPHMSVRENITSGLKLRKTPPAVVQQRLQEVGEFLELQELMERKPAQLSGGQRQRVAVARALVRRPDLFLLDEPLSNLDALLREQVRAELKQLFATQNAPVVYVTHDQTEAMTLSTQVAVLNNGWLQQLDSPDRIYTHPANQFVAGFIGSPQMNFFQLACEQGAAILGNARIPLPLGLTPPARIILGIRPEHLQPAVADDNQTLQGRIVLVENLGMHHLVSLRLTNPVGEDFRLRALLPVNQPYRIGETLKLTLPADAIHWFDAETGNRLSGSRG